MIQIWQIWVIVAIACIILEIFTSGFAVACFSIGAVFAALAAACGLGLIWQVIIFSVFSFLAFMFVRPFILKTFFKPAEEKQTNAQALIGRKGRVSQTIDPAQAKGRVSIDGDDWKAVSEDGQAIPKGSFVEVVSIESIILTVKKI